MLAPTTAQRPFVLSAYPRQLQQSKAAPGRKAASRSIEGTKHGHGPEPSENTCNKYECDFLEWETLLGLGGGCGTGSMWKW